MQSRREILNDIFYAVRSGCAWKQLTRNLPVCRTFISVSACFWSCASRSVGIVDQFYSMEAG